MQRGEDWGSSANQVWDYAVADHSATTAAQLMQTKLGIGLCGVLGRKRSSQSSSR